MRVHGFLGLFQHLHDFPLLCRVGPLRIPPLLGNGDPPCCGVNSLQVGRLVSAGIVQNRFTSDLLKARTGGFSRARPFYGLCPLVIGHHMTNRFTFGVPTDLLRRAVLGGIAATALALPLAAQDPDRVILTVTLPDGSEHVLTDAELDALPWTEFTTTTRWTEGPQVFRGPSAATIFAHFGLRQEDLTDMRMVMNALNDFVVQMPATDAYTYQAMFAREANGAKMRVRDKGPLWLVFPRDSIAALRDPIMDERWIWQLSSLRLVR